MPWDEATALMDTKNTTKENTGELQFIPVKSKENSHCALKDWKPIEYEKILTDHLSDKSNIQNMYRTLKTRQ